MVCFDDQLVSEGSQLELLSIEKAARSVLILNISPKLRRDDIMIYFQKKKNDGGEVDDVFIIDGKAVIVFEKQEGSSSSRRNGFHFLLDLLDSCMNVGQLMTAIP